MSIVRNARIRGIALQVGLVGAILGAILLLAMTTVANLRARGIPLGFAFLGAPSGMPIAESLIRYSLDSTYARALLVGLVNTLVVSVLVILLASLLGLFLGIARLSGNPAVAALARGWVEIARNTPLLVLLLFVYGLWSLLPDARDAFQPLPGTFLSQRGLVIPHVSLGAAPTHLALLAGGSLALLLLARRAARRVQDRSGRRPRFVAAALVAVAGAAGFLWFAGMLRPGIEWPEFRRFNFVGGQELSPEFATLVAGLTLYTAGFIGEIVRGGILAIQRGQWEAAGALGLSRAQTLRLVVIPLALRVMVPPLNSQYINVVKNSTLAIAVGYQEFFTVAGTVINRTSHAIEGIVLILGTYLLVNLSLSAVLNWYNRRLALAGR